MTLVTWGLVVLDITDAGMRRWWAGHALTTNTVSGLLVLMITLLVVDQVVRYRQLSDRARAVGARRSSWWSGSASLAGDNRGGIRLG